MSCVSLYYFTCIQNQSEHVMCPLTCFYNQLELMCLYTWFQNQSTCHVFLYIILHAFRISQNMLCVPVFRISQNMSCVSFPDIRISQNTSCVSLSVFRISQNMSCVSLPVFRICQNMSCVSLPVFRISQNSVCVSLPVFRISQNTNGLKSLFGFRMMVLIIFIPRFFQLNS